MTLAKNTPQGKPLPMSSTELHTWFERDRAHVELRDERTDKTIVEWWDDAVREAVEDGFLRHAAQSAQCHADAYDYAKNHGMLPIIPNHFIAGSGERGCLYDNCYPCHTLNEAVESLAETFSLGRTRKAELKRNRTLELKSSRDGAEYCEITECDCDAPWEHSDAGMDEDSWNLN